MICTSFTGHPVKGVFSCVILINLKRNVLKYIVMVSILKHPKEFQQIVLGARYVNGEELLMSFVSEALKPRLIDRTFSPDEKLELVSKVIAGQSCLSIAIENNIDDSLLSSWVHKYKIHGYNGFIISKEGRPRKNNTMDSKKIIPSALTESEREELIRLRAENAYIKAENEVIKKEIALREEKHAALLKEKKQQLSKNSAKRDTN